MVQRWYNRDDHNAGLAAEQMAEAIEFAKAGLRAAKATRLRCAHCSKGFESRHALESHARQSWCARRVKAHKAYMAEQNAGNSGKKVGGVIDPLRPELGKVPRYSLMWKLLSGR